MTPVAVEILRLPNGVGIPLPQAATEQAAGYDLHAALPENDPLTLAPGGRALIPTGFAIALPPHHEAQVRPRSGLALKHGITTLNSPGTIDADYRGEIGVILINLGQEPWTVHRGTRIAQLIIAPVTPARWVPVTTLSATARGAGGFGSTGLREAQIGDEEH